MSSQAAHNEEGLDLGFTYHIGKSGEIEILRQGLVAATIRSIAAVDFPAEVEGGFAAGQQVMARVTGN